MSTEKPVVITRSTKVPMWRYGRPSLGKRMIVCGPDVDSLLDAIRNEIENEDELDKHHDFRIDRVMMSERDFDKCAEFEGW